jgi:hypothetical protein
MKALIIIEDTDEGSTPGIILDKENNKFEIVGNSLPENIYAFYDQVFSWIEEYKEQPNPKTKFTLKLNYFNSSSLKALLEIFAKLEEIIAKGYEVEIDWHYLEMDEDLFVTGKEFQGLLKVPFNFIAYQE